MLYKFNLIKKIIIIYSSKLLYISNKKVIVYNLIFICLIYNLNVINYLL